MERNYIVDDQNVVWCPLRPSEIWEKYPESTKSLAGFIRAIYYPKTTEILDTIYLSHFAQQIVYFPQNDRVKQDVHDTFDGLYKRRNRLPLRQQEALALYDEGVIDEKQLSALLFQDDLLPIDSRQKDDFIFIPTADPLGEETTSRSASRSGAGNQGITISKRQKRVVFLYFDMGGWSSPQKRKGRGHAAFGMISPDEVALWDVFAPSGTFDGAAAMPQGSKVKLFKDTYHKVLGGDIIFYASISPEKGVCVAKGNSRSSHRFSPRIPTPLTDNEMLFFIPDLHLHLFPGYSVDNFLEPWKGGDSLSFILKSLFDYIADFSKIYPVSVIQLGDMYELWESALLFLFAKSSSCFEGFLKFGIHRDLLSKLRDALNAEISRRGLDRIFQNEDIEKLEKARWNSAALKPIWEKMKTEIQKAQTYRDLSGRDAGLFTRTGRINIDVAVNSVGGNHDSFVSDVSPKRFGVKDSIFVEHGHLRDDHNTPDSVDFGVLMTGFNVVAELKGVGDELKSLEPSYRPQFVAAAAETNDMRVFGRPGRPEWQKIFNAIPQFRETGRPHYVVVNGHTHRAYAGLMSVDSDLPMQYQMLEVLYDAGWRKFHFFDSAKTLLKISPRLFDVYLDNAMTGALVVPPLSVFSALGRLSK